ncbi:hypothetical protein CEQ90_12560 [Lewinellaceae bacterium SD302]|nr:hypothetical protein CEQ90_12560 [Lewinellaceae bacterium SD302]
MRNIYLFVLLSLFAGQLLSQTVIAERTAELEDAGYVIEGTAVIREYDDGSITLSLSDDFETPAGPDVRIYLNDQLNPNSAVELVNLSTINHFNGAITLDVPAGTDLEENSNIVFYCFAFNQLWASGAFGDPVDPNPMMGDTCQQSLTATFAWVTNVEICGNDGEADPILLLNNIDVDPGDNYAFLLTDTNEVLLEVIVDSIYDFEGKGLGKMRIYGVSYVGELSPQIGQDRMMTTASECFIHSGGNLFLTVDMGAACAPSSLNEVLTKQTRLYPNPVIDLLTIELPANYSAEQLIIHDLNGRVVRQQVLEATQTKLQTSVDGLTGGQYVLSISGAEGLLVKRFVVK